jgi:uncharacterized protein
MKDSEFTGLWEYVANSFRLEQGSIHGPNHWNRVERFGLRVGEICGADLTVVRLFALFHDSQRITDGYDPLHGTRSAHFVANLRSKLLNLQDNQMRLLEYACMYHADGFTTSDTTVGACWDGDRLDLWRVGLKPDPSLLNTSIAQSSELIAWSRSVFEEDCVRSA